MDTFKTMEGERIEQLERDKVALMAEIQDLKRQLISVYLYGNGVTNEPEPENTKLPR